MNKKKIGVLLPQSKVHPTMVKDFVDGLKLMMPSSNYSFCIEGIGLGDNAETVINAIQKLVYQEDVVLITGLLGHRGLGEILDYVEGTELPFLYADFGATMPLDLSKRKNIFCNSLDLYQACNALGRHLISRGLSRIMTSTCYYESGYGFTQALHDTLYENNKAEFTGHFITPLHPRENEAELMKQFVLETKPDAIFAFYNGIYAKEHAEYLQQNKINKTTALYTLPFTVDDKILNEFPEVFNTTKCVSSWFKELETKENEFFVKLYNEKYNKIPSVFSVLGFENGLLINNYLNHENSFSKEKITGPRGVLLFDSTHRISHKQFLWELSWENNSYKHNCLEILNSNFKNLTITSEENGWHNAYLCV
ncbi:ABC transporter substrate-binding protein [Olleya sp. YSTF-M6]|uniref:ABC transporter substrate-binding protein n=1 Tax=Olleya sediminilitoris TaxID=2795739 RepID=A0ABS1WGF1_9FLAO|nr:ABC transporter substrate-binding protein [Olleya sediminilitoris]MBL7558206.1 ABC transporter substrate-binding protein [Olleya sediminilitoris]